MHRLKTLAGIDFIHEIPGDFFTGSSVTEPPTEKRRLAS